QDKSSLQTYATEEICLFKQTLFGFLPINLRRTFLTVKLKNTPLGSLNYVNNLILEAFQDFGTIASIKPLFFEGTTVLSDQWLITFETTDNPDVAQRLSRTTHLDYHK